MALPAGINADIQPFAELARHATTVVYKAYQRSPARFVLLKVLRPALAHHPDLARRFEEEARLLARIAHPNVVATYEFGQDDGRAFLVTEFVEGLDAAALLAEHGPLPCPLALYILREMASGLAAAHAEGILHRDLKPANVLLAHDGAVKLTDFGLASVEGAIEAEGHVRGTPAYLAPELVGGAPPTPAADLFGLGATFYELLSGQPAFSGEDVGAVLHAVRNHDPLPFLEATVALPEAARALCRRLLAKDPAARFERAQQVVAAAEGLLEDYPADAAALAAYLQDPEARPAPSPSPSPPAAAPPTRAPQPPPRRMFSVRTTQLAFVSLALLIIFVLGYGSLAWREAPPSPATPPDRVQLSEVKTARDASPDSSVVAASEASAPATAPARFGTLRVASDPPADIWIDGQHIGTTPFAQPQVLRTGTHQLVLRHPDFPERQLAFRVRANQQTTLDVSLWEQVGALTVDVYPWAEVLIDGELRDTTPLDGPLVVRPGSRRLTLRHPKLGSFEQTISVEAGQARTLYFDLLDMTEPDNSRE